MHTYLLEKSRVVYQATEERNYHIFYQFCLGKDALSDPNLHLSDCENFRYLNVGKTSSFSYGNHDIETELGTVVNSFSTLAFLKSDRENIVKIINSILYLGNIQFEEFVEVGPNIESCTIPSNDIHCKTTAEL